MRNWSVYPLRTGLFTGKPDPERLMQALIERTRLEWKLTRTIREKKRVWLFCATNEHLLIVLHTQEGLSAFLLTDEGAQDVRKSFDAERGDGQSIAKGEEGNATTTTGEAC